MRFMEVAHAFQIIEPITSRLEMTRMLAKLFGAASHNEAHIIANLSLGQLNAPYVGTHFNIAEKNAIKAIAQLLKKTPENVDAMSKELGDLGLVVSSGQHSFLDNLTVEQVYRCLKDIESIGGTGSSEEKNNLLMQLLSRLDPISSKFVVRIILGKLRLGFSDMTIIDALSWMYAGDKSQADFIEDAYNVCADIGLIASTIKSGGIDAIKNMHIHVGIPIRPAAAERMPSAQAIIDKVGSCHAEPKIDGFRLQVHIDNSCEPTLIKFFSRNLQDMSAMFPDLTASCKNIKATTLICEGETIAYDPHTQSFLPFQETVKRRRKHDIGQASLDVPLKLFLFDVLYFDGNQMLSTPFIQRRHTLEHLISVTDTSVLGLIEEKAISSVQELENYFHEKVTAGLEGLVIKRTYAHYTPGKRNFNWIKLKRLGDKLHPLEDTIDCVILGYYRGSGKRAQFGIGAFLVGVFNKNYDRFETIAKVGTGLKDDDWVALKKKCDAQAVESSPKNVVCSKELAPDVWVAPEIVCCIRADEITVSPLHSAGKTHLKDGYALRFPRFIDYRTDKFAHQATTVDEIEHLFKDQVSRDE